MRGKLISFFSLLLLMAFISCSSKVNELNVGFNAPFQTDADMKMYYNDQKGIVVSDGQPVTFYYKNIANVLESGKPCKVLERGANRIRVELTKGEHEIQIVTGKSQACPDLNVPTTRAQNAVSGIKELKDRLTATQPGDTLLIKNGIYESWRVLIDANGKKDHPVTIQPESPGGVIFRGDTQIGLTGHNIVFKGFRFEHCGSTYRTFFFSKMNISPERKKYLEKFEFGQNPVLYIDGGDNNRISQCQFFHCGDAWNMYAHILSVRLESDDNRVDHCFFTGSKSMSLGLRDGWYDEFKENVALVDTDKIGQRNRFDHNIFRDVYSYWRNGQENVQLGQGGCPGKEFKPKTCVEYNVFDNAWGDGETISVKTSENIIRHNVVVNCKHIQTKGKSPEDVNWSEWGVWFRGGNHNIFEGNICINNETGLVVFGNGHKIINNTFVNLHKGVFFWRNAIGRPGRDCLFANNTFVNCDVAVSSKKQNLQKSDRLPDNNTFINNIFLGRNTQQFVPEWIYHSTVNNNLFWLTGSTDIGYTGDNAIIKDPMLFLENNNYSPSSGSPVINSALELVEVDADRWGVKRPVDNRPDLGAVEVTGDEPAKRKVVLPDIPPLREHSIDYKKGDVLYTFDPVQPLKGWETAGDVSSKNNSISLGGSEIKLPQILPENYIIEWQYLPSSFRAKGAILFSADDEKYYTIEWGGAETDIYPASVMYFKKGNSGPRAILTDLRYVHMDYYKKINKLTYNLKKSQIIPDNWYKFRLIRIKNKIRLEMNLTVDDGEFFIPVFFWEDKIEFGEERYNGSDLIFKHENGTGTFKEINIRESRAK